MDQLKNQLLSGIDPELDCFDLSRRQIALEKYLNLMASGGLFVPAAGKFHNLHCHSFFSYNYLSWSPSHVALAGKLLGLGAVGLVDFDVLDGVDEFLKACQMLNLPAIAGMETRVYIPDFAGIEINSPGEAAVAYHLAVGFSSSKVSDNGAVFLRNLKLCAASRTRTVVEKVNQFLQDLTLDFDREILPATPAGNPTERHVCTLYRLAAEKKFGHEALDFWQSKLGFDDKVKASCVAPAVMDGTIRSKLMKGSGPAAVKASADSFPTLEAMNRFAEECGALPCVAWLNGFSDGESDPEKLLDFHCRMGAKALTLIPDRNWNIADPDKKKRSIANLYALVEVAQKKNLPLLAGTELNTPGQKLVDDFGQQPLATLLDLFYRDAMKVCR